MKHLWQFLSRKTQRYIPNSLVGIMIYAKGAFRIMWLEVFRALGHLPSDNLRKNVVELGKEVV